MNQVELVRKLDAFFQVKRFDERGDRTGFPPGYDSVLQRYVTPEFWEGAWNGLMLDNAPQVDRVYCCVFPAQNVLDKIIAREVERGAPGAMIFCHHMGDYHETGPGFVAITEPQLQDLREHHISYYHCHAPLDCHPIISTSSALAAALKMKDCRRFAPYHGGLSGVFGTVTVSGFGELAKRCAETLGLNTLRYSALRNNGRPVNQVAIVTGLGGTVDNLREALELGCDTFVTGEWWLFGPGEWRATRREKMREFLTTADLNLIGTSHYASEMPVMRDSMPEWFREETPTIEALFVPQDDPWK